MCIVTYPFPEKLGSSSAETDATGNTHPYPLCKKRFLSIFFSMFAHSHLLFFLLDFLIRGLPAGCFSVLLTFIFSYRNSLLFMKCNGLFLSVSYKYNTLNPFAYRFVELT